MTSVDRAARKERFLALLDPVYARLESFALAMERDRDAAFDLVGDTVLRAYERFDELRDEKAFLAWLLVTARRLHLRRRSRLRLFREEEPGYADDLVADTTSPEITPDLRALHDALSLLPVKQREAVVLFEIVDLSLAEVREIQGGTLSALKVRLHRGRRRLAELLGVADTSDRGEKPERKDAESAKESNVVSP